MKINNLIIKIFLGLYLVIIIAGVIVFENIGFSGGGLEKNIHTASNSETQPVTVKDISSETISKTTPATVKETASSQAATKQETTAATEKQTSYTETAAPETASAPSELETIQTESESTQPAPVSKPSYIFANGRITNTSDLKNYRVTGASYVNMHKDKTGSHSFATVPGGTTGSIISVGAYYTLIDYNGTRGYVYNSYLEVY